VWVRSQDISMEGTKGPCTEHKLDSELLHNHDTHCEFPGTGGANSSSKVNAHGNAEANQMSAHVHRLYQLLHSEGLQPDTHRRRPDRLNNSHGSPRRHSFQRRCCQWSPVRIPQVRSSEGTFSPSRAWRLDSSAELLARG